jgi:hypothetical protein
MNSFPRRLNLSVDELVRVLSYDSASGEFIWLGPKKNGTKDSRVAGAINPSNGYHLICINGLNYYSHRLAWLYMMGEWPAEDVDHLNHIRTDNRWSNLRAATYIENGKNISMPKLNTSGRIGVSWHNKRGLWVAKIGSGGKPIFLGDFKTFDEAVAARAAAEVKHGFHTNHGRAKCQN